MRPFRLAGLMTLLFLSGELGRADNTVLSPDSPDASSGYQLVWSDDFRTQPNGPPDPAKWSYEEGFLRNNEQQYYTRDRRENARIENGLLVIEGRREDYLPPGGNHTGNAIHYTSASLTSKGKSEWQYGRIEVKAQLPSGRGVWPAIWTLGSNIGSVGWPRCGEIDMMEFVGSQPNVIHGTVHYFANSKHASEGKPLTIDHPESAFHLYAVEWTPLYIDFFVDNQRYFHFDVKKADAGLDNPFHQPHFMILNLALGGSWGGKIDNAIFPQRMSVAYVRVYEMTEVTHIPSANVAERRLVKE